MPDRPATVPTSKRSKLRHHSMPAAAIDMGGLDTVIGYAIRRAQVAIFQDTNEILGEFGITPVKFAIIRLVQRNPGINQTTLAAALGADAPRMVLLLDALERRGLVVRLASTVDRRARALFLTPKGRALHARLSRRVAGQNRRLARRLRGDDAAALLRMLRNLTVPGKDEGPTARNG